jgi:uncharacterized protein (TIGR02452 family)
MNRSDRAAVAAETIEIGATGVYVNENGESFDIREQVQRSITTTSIVDSNLLVDAIKGNAETRANQQPICSQIEIVDKTTLDAANSSLLNFGTMPTILNFASAKHPGGGFQNGSLSQEEDIAYRSTLFAALDSKSEYYEESRRTLRSGLYFDKMLYTEGLVVIRGANYQLTKPWCCNCITAPAPNRGAALQNGVAEKEIDRAMRRRIIGILELAVSKGVETLILGAFGCGVFKNEPDKVAECFKTALIDEGRRERFRYICFAIPGVTSKNYQEFERVFTCTSIKVPQN